MLWFSDFPLKNEKPPSAALGNYLSTSLAELPLAELGYVLLVSEFTYYLYLLVQ